jgi:hypothetical protein
VDGEAEVDGEVLACMTEQFGALAHRLDLAPLIVLSFGYSLELGQRLFVLHEQGVLHVMKLISIIP